MALSTRRSTSPGSTVPGGQLALTAAYANATQVLDLDLVLSEPENGILANLLGIEGRPPMALALKGSGPLSNLDLNLTLDAASQRVLTGTTSVRQEAGGFAFESNLHGPDRKHRARAVPRIFRRRDDTHGERPVQAGGRVQAGQPATQ